ncbi:MAG: S1 family peptidase, partial [Chloroflexia bacterium]
MKSMRFIRAAGLLLALLVVAAALGVLPAQALDRPTRQKIVKAVVQIVAADREGKNLTPKWTGSGTIVSPDGLILTNCHVAYPRAMWDDPEYDRDVLIVSLTVRSDQPPQPTYLAEVVQYDPHLDLAVIRVTHTLDGTPVDRASLNLPTVPLGDSDELEIGDPITIFGYPGIGGETITLTSGDVSGFTLERGIAGRAWIKTDATIAGGNSGGTAVDDSGLLIGVPTQGGAGTADRIVDCRYIADTNGDGKIDENDTCVPMGGFINALRPINLAKPLIEAAARGLGPQPTTLPQPTARPSGPARVSRLFFAPGANEYDQPTTVVDSFPSGTEVIYLFFDYANFQDGTPWHPVLVYNGRTYEDVWQAGTWSGGPEGNWWISVSDEPLEDGTYEFQLYYDGQKLGSKSVRVGGTVPKAPAFLNLRLRDDAGNEYALPAGVRKITATFDYQNMETSTRWSYRLYEGGRTVETKDGPA